MSMPDLKIKLGNLEFRNPVLTASGTFGYGEEFSDFIDLGRLGGVVVKAVTGKNRDGNAYPRMAETPSGMLNSVGLQNKGADYFVREIYPRIKDLNTHLIVNVSGSTIEEYVEVAEKINSLDKIPAIELNISCPNVKQGGMAFGTVPATATEVTRAVRNVYKKMLIVKLSPNVTSITELAKAVVDGGADVISLINTLLGMAIDAESRKPVLSTITGGLSGSAIKPIALRMVWQVSKTVKVPVIGLGGIMNAADAIEFLLAGASAVQVGTANFIDPQVTVKIVDGIEDYLKRHKIDSVTEIIGALKTDTP
jgi:dihydroorotate dehydrogenase (NAD+) catalytic subunit